MKKTTTVCLVTVAAFLFVIFMLNTANAQLNIDNTLKAPFISVGNSKQNIQSLMQNSEKDIVFIENLGQIRDTKGNKRPDVLFLTRSQGVDMYITSTGITYVFRKTKGDVRESATMRKDKVEEPKTSLYRLDMEFVGVNKNLNVKKEFAVEQKFNYYTPEYPNGISSKAYKKITVENIYDGIDLVYYEKDGKMKYDFVVKAGADPDKIEMKYKGAGNVFIDKDGSVIITTLMGEIREKKPFTYSRSTGLKIESGYKVKDNLVQFGIAEYNKSEDIIIDPYRIWATYYGGNGGDGGNNICTDNSGNLYVTGWTASTNFPIQTLSGAYNQTALGGCGGDFDVFILKFNNSGVRQWATYYGGDSLDAERSICTDNSGNLYVTGWTASTNFPIQTLSGAYNQTTLSGSNDAFILKFNSSGARLWATYYGGSSYDAGAGFCTDNSGNLYVTGQTKSTNFPTKTLTGAYNQTALGGSGGYGDAFILKFNSSGVRLWATYYGGNGNESGYAICTDNSGNLYVTGYTWSTNFPTKTLTGAYNQTTLGGNTDVFILKFNSSGARLWATYYGGSNDDYVYSICTDNSGNLYVTGQTKSTNFPTQTLSGAYNQTTYGGGQDGDAFILKFNSSSARLWATYYGGSSYDAGAGFCTDNSGNFYVTGGTASTNFPTQTLTGAYNQTILGGSWDVFILKFNSSSARLWATYYGGSSDDDGRSICTNNSGNLYVTGRTISTNFPTHILTGAYNQTTLAGSNDAFILNFNSSLYNLTFSSSNYYPILNSTIQLSGKLTDGNNNPIPNTTIEIEDPFSMSTTTVNTNSTGNFNYSTNVPQDADGLYAFKSGYQNLKQVVIIAPRYPTMQHNLSNTELQNILNSHPNLPNYVTSISWGTPVNLIFAKDTSLRINTMNNNNNIIYNESACSKYLSALQQTHNLGFSMTYDDQRYIRYGSEQFKKLAQECAFEPRSPNNLFAYSLLGAGCIIGGPESFGMSCFPLLLKTTGDFNLMLLNNNHALTQQEKEGWANAWLLTGLISSITGLISGGQFVDPVAQASFLTCDIYDLGTAAWDVLSNRKIYGYSGNLEAVSSDIRLPSGREYKYVIRTNSTKYTTIGPSAIQGDIMSDVMNLPSSLDFHIYDSQNHHVGRNSTRPDSLDEGILEVFHSGLATDIQSCTIIYPDQTYQLRLQGDSTFTGVVPINIKSYIGNTTVYETNINANLAPNTQFIFNIEGINGTIGINKNINFIPTKFELFQNYPNPFNPTTDIRFDLPKSSYTKLVIYDVLGKEVGTLINKKLDAGSYQVNWDGSGYPSGVYLYNLVTKDFNKVRKMMLIK